jgi:hypothetical protein
MSHRDARPRIGKSDRIAFARSHHRWGSMEEQGKKADELAETKPLETIPSTNATEGEETQRLRALTVQEIEQILSDETPQ